MISEQNDKTRMSALPPFFKSNAFETFHCPHMIDHEKLHMTNYYFSKSSSSKK